MEEYKECSECGLEIKPYKQNSQEREDICENCHICRITTNEEEYLLDQYHKGL